MVSRNSSENSITEFITNREEENTYARLFDTLLRTSEWCRWAVAFIKKTGVDCFSDALKEAAKNGAKMRCLTSFDFKQTEPLALLELMNYGVEVRLIAKGSGTYHPKMYLFSENERHHALIGSANFTRGAFHQNIEAGVHIVGGKVVSEMGSFFADHWNDKRTVIFNEQFLKDNEVQLATWKEQSTDETPPDTSQFTIVKRVKTGSKLVERIHSVMKPGIAYSIDTVTKLVIEKYPDWDFGLTPDASIRRDLNYYSTRHPDESRTLLFEAIARGKYRRLK